MGYNLMLPVIVLEKVLIFQTFIEPSAHILPSSRPSMCIAPSSGTTTGGCMAVKRQSCYRPRLESQ